MSWDIFLFNTRQEVSSVEEIDEEQLEPMDFCSVFESHFNNVEKRGNHREIKGENFSIDYCTDEIEVTNKMLSLYGENGLYELVVLAKQYNWQIYDTGFGQMVDLENPANNGYENFQNYVKHVLKSGT